MKAVPEEITKSIPAAIDGFKAMMMVHIDRLASECTLIYHDLDKMRGRITKAEVEDQQGSHTSQIVELQSLVSSLVNEVDDTENRQRQNNIRVVGLRPAIFG